MMVENIFMIVKIINGTEHLGGTRKLQKTRYAKNAPIVQKNVDIHIHIIKIQQNVAAAEQTKKNKKY
jgi:hypothetical protein